MKDILNEKLNITYSETIRECIDEIDFILNCKPNIINKTNLETSFSSDQNIYHIKYKKCISNNIIKIEKIFNKLKSLINYRIILSDEISDIYIYLEIEIKLALAIIRFLLWIII